MIAKTVRRIALSLGLGAALAWFAVLGLSAVGTPVKTPPAPAAVAAINRPRDPVVVAGASFPGFSGVPRSELKLYAYRSGAWAPIPFQIDEVNISNTYVISDGGLLDANDELVFMAGDAGDGVSAATWPLDPASRLHSRYAITVTDPLSPAIQAWVYLYRSTTLARSGINYITWTEATQTASAVSYTAAFSPTRFVGLANLFINDRSVDILDRQKIRVGTLLGTLNEEVVVTFLGAATVTLPAAGPVRAVTNDGDLKGAFYGSRIDFDVIFNLSAFPILPSFIRTSFDWNNPITTGITTYYDSNTPGGVTIDGAPDVVSTTPPIDWAQVNGASNGPGGVVLAIPYVNPGPGAVSNYYKDDSAIDANDTGDQRSYGDSGLRIDGPGSVISFTLAAFILPPGTSANVGAVYFDRINNPLTAAVAEQCFRPSGTGCLRVYLPLVMKN